MNKSILIIDDDADMCQMLTRFLSKNGFTVDSALSGNKGIEKFKAGDFDVVLCDYRLGDKKDGKDILLEIKQYKPTAIVLIITGYSDIKTAVEVIKAGAHDYITKPMIPDQVLNVLYAALKTTPQTLTYVNAEVTNDKTYKKNVDDNPDFLVGNSLSTKALYRQIEIVAPTNYSIILHGESGTGKEVIAKTIHSLSSRKDKPFIAMDCGTLSKELAGSELFGHIKGAFTGAINDKEGHFEMANGGTLFLDEVANLSPETQASLLRVIQERKFKRIGGNKEMEVDVRIIVATNENLQEAYKNGRFREDLYHRFNEFSIDLPPLRNRKEDIPLFANFFLQKTNKELGKQVEGFEDEVMDMFIHYSWPGNLRECRNVIRRSVLLTNFGKIAANTLPSEITGLPHSAVGSTVPFLSAPVFHMATMDLKDTASKAEYEAIMKVLKEVNFNKTKAAEILNIDRKTLYNKIKSFEDAQLTLRR